MDLPKIALLGYGKMGKTIESLAKEQGFVISEIFDEFNPIKENKNYLFDVALDFSIPSAVVKNVKIVSQYKKNIVIGTTGWLNQKDIIFDIITKNGIGVIYSSNFSIGILIIKKLLQKLSSLLNNFDFFDIAIAETHHNKKIDAPSGTALDLANEILKNYNRKKEIAYTSSDLTKDKLLISSIRLGEVFGEHRILVDSFSDHIELIHQAKNRIGFAQGALLSAKWIYNKKGIYKFEDIFE